MNKQLLVTVLLAISAVSVYYTQQEKRIDAFEQWKVDFGTPFSSFEDSYRRIIFEKNVKRIEEHNSDKTQTYTKGINQFTIYTDEEFKVRFLADMMISETPVLSDAFDGPNIEIDWTTKKGVSRVKNQGQCGSCWAFSATGVFESWLLVSKNQGSDLSEQQLVDCSGSYGNHGCNGGWPSNALKYVIDKGIASESEYPYKGVNGACARNGGSYKISGQSQASGSTGLQNDLSKNPISVTVDASNWSSYKSGVLGNCAASINHAVLLVGVVGGNWKIKNSWGTSWGEGGYIRLQGTGNTCGICAYPGVYPR